jgi:hypothetical protein
MWLAAGSLVGMLFIVVALSEPLKKSPQKAADPQVVNVPERAHSQPPDHGQPQAVSPPVNNPPVAIPESDRDVYYDLAQKAAGALGEVAVYVMPGSSPPPMAPSDAGPEGAAGWIDGVKHQLQPIGRSLDDAFDFLWEAGQSADSSKT